MSSRAKREFRRAGKPVSEPEPPRGMRWHAKLALIGLTVVLLSLSFAPFGQFYLAWFGLVPWLLTVRAAKSQRAAFFWSWLAGIAFFVANMWWLAYVTGPGMVALMIILGVYWGFAALVIRGAGLLTDENENGGCRTEDGEEREDAAPSSILHRPFSAPLARVLLVPAVWVSLEWFRGNWPLNGLPWLFLGHAQTPVLPMCQVADALGVYGISFWVVAVNALVALFVIDRLNGRRLARPAAVVGAMLLLVLGYGAWRMAQAGPLAPGPLVMVVQSNYPQSNTGEKGASQAELVNFHVRKTDEALRQVENRGVDLVVWSETMMPTVNRAAREAWRGSDVGEFLEKVHGLLGEVTREHGTALLTGALFADKWTMRGGEPFPEDRRNTAFFYDRSGRLRDDTGERYDKIHIVPFGEYLPFKSVFPPLYRFILSLSPYSEEYFLTPGDEGAMMVFRLEGSEPPAAAPATGPSTTRAGAPASARRPPWRFVTPICFEDIDPLLVGKMFRSGAAGSGKSADFIVNITNDGWFRFNQMPQHLQAARFRSIENRAPTARSVNTGISGFVDSVGRVHGLVPAGVEGSSVQRLQLDSRVTLYTRFGDVFAAACAAVTILLTAASVVGWWRRRRATCVQK
jgi:apolipoprotein N-acyltransferase